MGSILYDLVRVAGFGVLCVLVLIGFEDVLRLL